MPHSKSTRRRAPISFAVHAVVIAGILLTLSGAAGAIAGAAPEDTPTISGNPIVGSTLTGSPGATTPAATGYAFRWRRCNSAGRSCFYINGATAQTYGVASSDVGRTIRVRVTATNSSTYGSRQLGSDRRRPVRACVGHDCAYGSRWTADQQHHADHDRDGVERVVRQRRCGRLLRLPQRQQGRHHDTDVVYVLRALVREDLHRRPLGVRCRRQRLEQRPRGRNHLDCTLCHAAFGWVGAVGAGWVGGWLRCRGRVCRCRGMRRLTTWVWLVMGCIAVGACWVRRRVVPIRFPGWPVGRVMRLRSMRMTLLGIVPGRRLVRLRRALVRRRRRRLRVVRGCICPRAVRIRARVRRRRRAAASIVPMTWPSPVRRCRWRAGITTVVRSRGARALM